jgi:FkbM family methyltransferase
MIVKNEEHIIIETLNNLCRNISFSYWVISDTGSTDNTKKLICDFFADKKIPGELVEHAWQDFAYNRTKALECAFGKSDYLFIFDADDSIQGNFKLPEICNIDKYQVKFGPGFVYTRPLMITNRKRWQFKGVLHETLSNIDTMNGETVLEGDYYVISGRSGNRSKNPNKYLDDAVVLKNAFEKEISVDYGMACRYAFYCAQSYKDAGVKYVDESIEWYTRVLGLGNWDQEKYYSCLMLGGLYTHKNDMNNALMYWFKSCEYDTERIECIISAINYLRTSGQNMFVNALYHRFKGYKRANKLQHKLFMLEPNFNDELEYHNSIVAYYVGDKTSGYACCKQIILNNVIEYTLLKSTLSNILFYKEALNSDPNTLDLFYAYDNTISRIYLENEVCSPKIFEVWQLLFIKNRDNLTKYKSKSITNSNNPTIFLSFTTCKRLDLFKQTINSMLTHWLDIDKVDYWFCVDDNSLEEDRTSMRTLYPWIDYHMKSVNEKGHRASMNIIWNKLKDLNPTYWIHMEDDFLFYNKMNYVEEAIKGLNTVEFLSNNVNQILFNRNYGEIINHYATGGHFITGARNPFVIHDYNVRKHTYENCHYWPHYSFRPSMVRVSTILGIGNFDSPNQFFEMDYANKWTEAGNKSGFFNKITNRHIGRLTSDKDTKTVKNAYELNQESQFTSRDISKFIKIINLERRPDRKAATIEKMDIVGISSSDYEFINGVDGLKLRSTLELKKLFEGNDFGSRRGFIGCAMSHYNLWKQLLEDDKNEYYVIMEDDFTFCPNFKTRYTKLLDSGVFKQCDVLFLGYHMFELERNKVLNVYNNFDNVDVTVVKPLNKQLFVGATHCYTINKTGARKMIDYIAVNGIKHGIDYVMKLVSPLNCFETQPQLSFADWNEDGKPIDTDIQSDFVGMDFNNIVDDTVNVNNKIIGFYDNQLCERGTTTALYDYAHFNEILLNNKSIIFYEKNNVNNDANVIQKFKDRFIKIFALDSFSDINDIIEKEGVDILYLIKYGNNDNKISTKCKNVVHCVFDCVEPHGNVYASISQQVRNNDNKYPVVPHMINLPSINKNVNLRNKLNIPLDAFVFGRYGGYEQFDISFVHETIFEYAVTNPNTYFLFANTLPFCNELPNIIHLDKLVDLNKKVEFINTCTAMIHARSDGETFGLSIAEFSSLNKPVITMRSEIDNSHLDLLGNKAMIYKNKQELIDIFTKVKDVDLSLDWNAYKEYTPEKVMAIFDKVFIQPFGFIFIPLKDQIDNDMYCRRESTQTCMRIALNDDKCVGFNTLGFFKHTVTNLTESRFFGSNDGIYIKRQHYENMLASMSCNDVPDMIELPNQEISQINITNIIYVKMLCNWASSEQLCKEWSNMCDDPDEFRWKDIRLTWTDDVNIIDYYVIINSPPPNTYYDPKKTIVFQMEPWVNDPSKNWGVKTWGKWSVPDTDKFLAVRGRKTSHHNNAFWQLELNYNQLSNLQEYMQANNIVKSSSISSICSSKYFDEGHIARIDLLKYIESKNDESVHIDIYNQDNNHQFKNYVGPVTPYVDKIKGMLSYKYYFMIENNYEHGFITEKIWEPILCESLVFYYGCPNISEYIDCNAYVLLDITDFEKSYQIIKRAIEEDWWSQRIDIIRKEKQRILNELAFFPVIEKIINLDKTTVSTELFGIKFKYFMNDCMASSSIGIKKEWESHIRKFTQLYNTLYNIKNIIDIGANFGYHALLFSRECSMNVYAFEPQIQNFQLLEDNVKNNNITNIILYNYACGDHNCEIKMPIYDVNYSINMGDITPNIDCMNKFSTTKSILLDDIKFPSNINLIKIDVQGWEKKVLLGAINLLKIHKPILIVEFEHFQLIKTNTSCKELFDYIRDQNYYVFYLDYCYPSDHICVHNDNLEDFRFKFKNYIFPHVKNNELNNNLIHGVNEKICV